MDDEKRIRKPVWVSWSPDASYLAVGYDYDQVIRVLDGVTGQLKFALEVPGYISVGDDAFSLAWSPTGKYLAASFSGAISTDEGVIRIWEISKSSTQITSTFEHPSNRLTSFVSWYVDESKIATTYWSEEKLANVLRIWNISDGSLLSEHENVPIGVWSPDGNKMIVAALNNMDNVTLQIVNGSTLKPLLSFPKEGDGYESLITYSWSQDSRYVAGVSFRPSDFKLWIWNADTGTLKDDFKETESLLHSISYATFNINSSGTLVSVVPWNNIYFWDVKSGELLNHLQINEEGSENTVWTVSWQKTKDIIAVGNGDGSIQVWQIDYDE